MRANAQASLLLQFVVYIVANKIAARHGHERHVAHRCDALRGHALHLLSICLGDTVLAQPLKTARKQLHGGCLMRNTRKLTVLKGIKTAARRRLGIGRHAQSVERRTVKPKRMAVARIHRAGAIGKRTVERTLGGMLTRSPAVIAPALRYHPGIRRKIARKFHRTLHQVLFAFAHIHKHVGRTSHGGMEEMQVRIVKTGTDKTIPVVGHGHA